MFDSDMPVPTRFPAMDPTDEQRREFGQRLLAARKAFQPRLTQGELASRLTDAGHPTTGSAIGGWERAEYAPHARSLVEVLEEELNLAPGHLYEPLGLDDPAGEFESLRRQVADLSERVTRLENKGTISRVERRPTISQTDHDELLSAADTDETMTGRPGKQHRPQPTYSDDFDDINDLGEEDP